MKRTIFLSLFLLLLVGVVVFLSRRGGSKASTDVYEGDFAVANVNDIAKIELQHRGGPTYTLAKTKDGWVIDGKYLARMSSVEPLLNAITQVRMKYIPGDAAVKNVLENIEGTYIHATIYDASGNVLRAYRVGGVTPDERGTYMLMDGSKQPFVVHIPAWDGAIRTRYSLDEQQWRDRKFMDITAEEIQSVTVEYPTQKSQSFQLQRSGQGFILSPVYPDLREYPRSYRNGTADAFLKAIADAACEGFENQYPLKDSIHALTPFCLMEITTRDEEKIGVKIWPKGTPVYTMNSPPIHRLFVERIPGDFVLVQYNVIKGMLRGYDYFAGIETELVF